MKYKYDFEFPIDWDIKHSKNLKNLYIGIAAFNAAYTGISLYGFNDNMSKFLVATGFLMTGGCFAALAAYENRNLKTLKASDAYRDAEEFRNYLHSSEERDQEIIEMVEKDLEKFEKRKLFERVK